MPRSSVRTLHLPKSAGPLSSAEKRLVSTTLEGVQKETGRGSQKNELRRFISVDKREAVKIGYPDGFRETRAVIKPLFDKETFTKCFRQGRGRGAHLKH